MSKQTAQQATDLNAGVNFLAIPESRFMKVVIAEERGEKEGAGKRFRTFSELDGDRSTIRWSFSVGGA